MLQSDNISQQLKYYYEEDTFQRQVHRLSRLPKPLIQIGWALIGAKKRDEPDDPEKQKLQLQKAFEDLSTLPRYERRLLFDALLPSIADEIEAAWQVFDHLPYQTGSNRRPFRLKEAQNNDGDSLRRCTWIKQLVNAVEGYNRPITWYATWAAHLGWGAPDVLGTLFAGAIDKGGIVGQEVFDILTASARGEHSIGKMGRHVVRGLLSASRPEGWDFIERLLLAAQREEGLRQVIMEAVDESHPEAFKHILRVVIEDNLLRFSAVVRAMTVWVGLPLDAASSKTVMEIARKLQSFMEHPEMQQEALTSGKAEDQYLALWSVAYENVIQAIGFAQPLLQRLEVESRFAAVYFLSQVLLSESKRILLPMLDDDDLRVATCAYTGITSQGKINSWQQESDLFERIEKLIKRLPEQEKTLTPIIWEWMTLRVDRKSLADYLVRIIGQRSPLRLLPYLKFMNPHSRIATAKLFMEHIDEDPQYRKAIFDLAGDRESYVHQEALSLLDKIKPQADEIPRLEALLTRKTSSLRQGIIGLLLHQTDTALLASIDRLLGQREELQHLAGIELLREMVRSEREPQECRIRVEQLRSSNLSEPEKNLLADIQIENTPTYSLEDALGLASPKTLSQPIEPHGKKGLFGFGKKIRLGSTAAAACIAALDDLVDQQRDVAIQVSAWQNESRTELLGNVQYGLVGPDPELSIDENKKRFQLAESWEKWWRERPDSQRDQDGLELLRARAALSLLTIQHSGGNWTYIVPTELHTYLGEPYDFHLKYEVLIRYILDWLIFLHPEENFVSFLVDAVEETLIRIVQHPFGSARDYEMQQKTIPDNRLGYIDLARRYRNWKPDDWTDAQHAQFWGLQRWLMVYSAKINAVYQPSLEDVLYAHRAGAATEADLFMYLLGEQKSIQPPQLYNDQIYFFNNRHQFYKLRIYSSRRPHAIFTKFPILRQTVERCRERILEVELRRGDLPTPASRPALALNHVPGIESLVHLLTALGKNEFARNGHWYGQDRSSVLSHLIKVSYPLENDLPDTFAAAVNSARISQRRLVELAVYAPQWARFVEYTLNWQGLAEGVWWVYAHTKDRQWAAAAEIRDSWAAQISEYTSLSADLLMDGAVDVAWFHRMYSVLGENRWKAVYQAAAYAATGAGHARARLFADAMLAKIRSEELIERIQSKRNQDALRALGLIPLPEDNSRQTEILCRYQVMQEFLRTSKKFGSQRQASEKLAVRIGLENLARSTGYTDPQRLEWAMEKEAIADLVNGPISIEEDGVCLTLSINYLGETELVIQRGDKILKNLPPALKKNERVTQLLDRRVTLDRQASRMRASLETAMVHGDDFSAGEVQTLMGHPILRVMLEQLIFVGKDGMGYPIETGHALRGLNQIIILKNEDRLRIAHPYDLLESKHWHEWQHECFVSERIQPFKQVFRELYILTQTEQDEKDFSRRYAGQQVNPRQALALFGARGWMTVPEEGVSKTFHSEGIVARVGFLQTFYTPAEVEGLTIEGVGFTRRGEWLPIKLDQVPAHLFSEIMRDLDLVVSIAHAGGVDPEASVSTIESRAALIQETCVLLKLANVRIVNRHALVDGKLGNYTIHLGSGTVHKQPGGALCIIPVHSQHKGRLFLPFIDNDPKTAEIISKVLLLSKDQEIKDPTILEQILK